MSRSLRPVRPAAALWALVLALGLTACDSDGGRHVGAAGGAGRPGVGDPYFPKAGNGGYDVGHYDLTLAYDPGTRRLTGTARVTARATQHLTAFDMDLKGLDVEQVTVDGVPARADRDDDDQELTVHPAEPLAKGDTFETTVRYAGRPEKIIGPDDSAEGWLTTADGAIALGQPTGSMAWFPGNHHPSDKATYTIAVTVPKGLTAVSNGELTSTRTTGGRTTF
ncbi:hypothetical protein ALMP_30240, partial [Streptomyces sp. A012304]